MSYWYQVEVSPSDEDRDLWPSDVDRDIDSNLSDFRHLLESFAYEIMSKAERESCHFGYSFSSDVDTFLRYLPEHSDKRWENCHYWFIEALTKMKNKKDSELEFCVETP